MNEKSELPYQVPDWGSNTQNENYSIEVLKNGCIVENFKFDFQKPYILLGRSEFCDIQLQHPSLSRYHAILQYCDKILDHKFPGYYIYDLGSTHGTYINKHKLEKKKFYRLFVGYVLKFGESTRLYVLNGPLEDQEDVYKEKLEKQVASEDLKDRDVVNWGIKEFSDLIKKDGKEVNESTEQMDESVFMSDPQKYLKNYLECQDLEFEVDLEEIPREKGKPKRYKCSLMLDLGANQNPLELDQTIEAVNVSKKEAMVECCVKALRLLNSYGLLKNPKAFTRKTEPELRAMRLIEDDFYESDEDEFSDRTGTLQNKRKLRKLRYGLMPLDVSDEVSAESARLDEIESQGEIVHTYESITETIQKLTKQIQKMDELIATTHKAIAEAAVPQNPPDACLTNNMISGDLKRTTTIINNNKTDKDKILNKTDASPIDPLDKFMANLASSKVRQKMGGFRGGVGNLKAQLTMYQVQRQKLAKQLAKYNRLLKIAEPSPNVKKLFSSVKKTPVQQIVVGDGGINVKNIEHDKVENNNRCCNNIIDQNNSDKSSILATTNTDFEHATKHDDIDEKLVSIGENYKNPSETDAKFVFAVPPLPKKLKSTEQSQLLNEESTGKIYGCVWKPPPNDEAN